MIELIKGDCLEVMKGMPDGSIDAIITDPPYGTTACKWDSVIDFDLMWEQLNRIIKPNGAIVLFGSEPFSSALRMSNIKNYKYDWVWEKDRPTGFQACKYKPMSKNENISIFGKNKINYYPIMKELKDSTKKRNNRERNYSFKSNDSYCGDQTKLNVQQTKGRVKGYPNNILKYKKEYNNQFKKQSFHPTQKPLALMEYLIKTYTNEGETVLDFTMGSGSTLVACQNTNRNGIGIEMDEAYFKIAQKRIKENPPKLL
jgi:site-specific DNA-methyltransferase (adenine-specific)